MYYWFRKKNINMLSFEKQPYVSIQFILSYLVKATETDNNCKNRNYLIKNNLSAPYLF